MIDTQRMREVSAFNTAVKNVSASQRAVFTRATGQAQLVIYYTEDKYFVMYRSDLYLGGIDSDYEVIEKSKRLKEVVSAFLEADIDKDVFKELTKDLKKGNVKPEYKIMKGDKWLKHEW